VSYLQGLFPNYNPFDKQLQDRLLLFEGRLVESVAHVLAESCQALQYSLGLDFVVAKLRVLLLLLAQRLAACSQLLAAGRCISGTHDAHASYRVKGPCLAMGQAAGTAAALAAQRRISPRQLDAEALRQALLRQNVTLDATERPAPGLSTDLSLKPQQAQAWEVPGRI